ncbi:MAG: nucleotidyltransferase domain-containing protein [Desulfuromonadales bacterium]|nr:nucleotidyltransferase domain-containing protein [Desulfuromonadales bacterium]MCK4691272.1 nucleotidyltransferase domain-containing protein [Desulfuromonadales bacterium]NOQ51058.1 nucleotidyltransferase domain-containing protein [Desulfuromonadaceae bacterium]
MRLKSFEIDAILKAVHHRDPRAMIYLFGSRVDDQKKGGDIDLLILSQTLMPSDKRAIRGELWQSIGEQKIDLVIAHDTSEPFVRIALETGVRL